MDSRNASLFALLFSACASPQTSPPAPIAETEATASSAPPPAASIVPSAPEPAPAPPELSSKSVDLPGAEGPVSLDLIAYDHEHGRIWVPVGDTGSVDVFDIAAGTFQARRRIQNRSARDARAQACDGAELGDDR